MKKILIILIMCALGLSENLRAQNTITIGEGTESGYAIADNYSGHGASQQIYTSGEIAAAGGSAGTITKIAFNKQSGANYNRTWSVYLKNTADESFSISSSKGMTKDPGTLVYDDTFKTPNGWVTFDIEDFQYDGSNLLVTIVDNSGNYGGDQNWYYTNLVYIYPETTTCNTLTLYAGSNIDITSSQSFSAFGGRFNIQLTIEGNGGSEPVVPSVPSNITATTNGQNSIDLSWNAMNGATSYNIYNGETKIATITETSYTVTGLTAGTNYCYSVTAVNNIGESGKSTEACATTAAAVPATPTNVRMTANGLTSVTLSWDPVAGATKYNIYNTLGWYVANTTNTTYTYSDALVEGHEYCFQVAAANDSGTSEKVMACATAGAEPDPEPTQQYRVKIVGGGVNVHGAGLYLNINSYIMSPTNTSYVGVADESDDDAQIFSLEDAGNGNYYLRSAQGYYIECGAQNSWNVDAYQTMPNTPLVFEYVNATDFYIRNYKVGGSSNYFKSESTGVYCDAPKNAEAVAIWTLEPVSAEPNPGPEPDPSQSTFDDFVFGQEYRITSVSMDSYLTIGDHNDHSDGAYGGIYLDATELNSQVFVVEDAGEGNVYFRSADGYYIYCWEWNIGAVDNFSALSGDGFSFAPFGQSGDGTQKTPFKLIDCGNGNFYIQINQDGHVSNGKYFKVEYNSTGGGYYPYCNADLGGAEEWTFEIVERNVPDAPALTATATSSTTIDLSWNAVPGATSYKVYGSSGVIAQLTGTSYQVTDLDHSTSYCFTVTALNSDGESVKSDEACATTLIGFDVTATDNTTKSTVEWNAPTGAVRYDICRKNVETDATETLANEITETTYDDNDWAGLPNGRYQYGVRAWMEEYFEMREDFLSGKTPDGWAVYNYSGDNLDESSKYDWQPLTTPNVNNYYAGVNTMTIVNSANSIMAMGTGRHFYLVTDVIDLTQITSPELSFRYNTPAHYGLNNTLKVKIIPAALGQGNAKANGTYVWTGTVTTGYTSSGEIDLSAYAGQKIYIAFESNVNQSWTSICNILITGDVIGYWTGFSWSNILAKGGFTYTGIGNWNEAANWSSGTVPIATDNVKIVGNATIASDVEVNSIIIADGGKLTLKTGTLAVTEEIGNAVADAFIIHDGTQVFHNGSNAKATYKMLIDNPDDWTTDSKGGWQFIASPIKSASTSSFTNQHGGDGFDLYKYDGTQVDLEWVNYKQHTTPDGGFFYSFDTGGVPSGFMQIDADGDGNMWGHSSDPDAEITVVDVTYKIKDIVSDGCLYSKSNRCTPDNYLVSPRALIFDGSVFSFKARTMFPASTGYKETFEVLVATKENPTTSDFTRVGGPYTVERETPWYGYSIDLSAYANQYVYIAILHNTRNSDRSLLLFDNAELIKGPSDDFDPYFVQGRGYLASYQTGDTAVFTGTLSHEKTFTFGTVDYITGKHYENFHLIGNPFSFDMDWSKMNAEGICSDGYATMTSDGTYEYHVSGTIKMGDGFFVLTKSAPTMTYSHNPRSSRRNNKNINVYLDSKEGRDNVIINFEGEEDDGFIKLENFNENAPEIYIHENDARYAIKNYNEDVKEVELKFVPKKMGNYTIEAVTEGNFNTVTLVDRYTGIETNLLIEDYKFNAKTNDDPRRFVVRFGNGGNKNEETFVYQSGDELIVDGTGLVQVIDVMGRIVYSNDLENTNNRINVSALKNAAYMVRCINDNQVKTQKIVIL